MSSVSIQIPDDLRGKIEARAAETGHGTVQQYVEALIRADVAPGAGEDYGAPPESSFRTQEELALRLKEGLNSPATEMTAADWEEMRRKLVERHAAQGGR